MLLWFSVFPGCFATPDAEALTASDRVAVWREARIIVEKRPRYKWGGSVNEELGLDCSGFVFLVYRRAGLCVGRTTSRNMRMGLSGWGGTDVRDGAMLVGDLIFWTWRQRPDRPDGHVGIVMRSGTRIDVVAHASPGRGVILEALHGRLKEEISARISVNGAINHGGRN